jgi:hypothetical protein
MAWIDLDAADTSGAEVIDIADTVLIRVADTQIQGLYFSGGYDNIDHLTALAGGGWHHVAYAVTAGRQELYFDGVSVGSKTNAGALSYLAGNTMIGRHASDVAYDLDGRMHDVLVFPSALSTTQIAAVMAATEA